MNEHRLKTVVAYEERLINKKLYVTDAVVMW